MNFYQCVSIFSFSPHLSAPSRSSLQLRQEHSSTASQPIFFPFTSSLSLTIPTTPTMFPKIWFTSTGWHILQWGNGVGVVGWAWIAENKNLWKILDNWYYDDIFSFYKNTKFIKGDGSSSPSWIFRRSKSRSVFFIYVHFNLFKLYAVFSSLAFSIKFFLSVPF